MVDPQHEIEPYVEAAAAKNMRITHIFETHVQADHVSGARRLGIVTGALVLVHASAPVTFPHVDLEDGEEHELGNVRVTVLHTPGHTPDCICLLDERNGVLFGGDTINTGPIYAQGADSDVEAFARSTRRLAELADSVRVIYVPHFVRYAVDPLFLAEVADGFERVAAGEAALHPNQDYLGYPVQEASFERFSIFVAVPDEPPIP